MLTSSLQLRAAACLQGNYEFGISRIIKSLEPYHSKLSTGAARNEYASRGVC